MNRVAWGTLAAVAAGILALGSGFQTAGANDALEDLMERNRDHFRSLVDTAFFESAEKKLEAEDYRKIGQEANGITEIARKVRQNHSMGKEFDKLASDLEENAEKAAQAASDQDLPKINVHAGEMAEYCAECHNVFRWEKE